MSRFFNQFKSAFFNPNYGWKTTHFWGPIANWGLVGAAVYDATNKGPEVISIPMTYTMLGYSSIFMRFAWMVQPRNYLLFSCHLFNLLAQSYQLARGLKYQEETREKEIQLALSQGKSAPVYHDLITPEKAAGAFAAAIAIAFVSKGVRANIIKGSAPDYVKRIASHPAGIFTVHGWAPLFKWALSITNIIEYDRPVEKISTLQQTALAATGFIWARYSLVIIPKNWSLFAVNFVLGVTGAYHLGRKLLNDIQNPKPVVSI